jgi:hypothetical protein
MAWRKKRKKKKYHQNNLLNQLIKAQKLQINNDINENNSNI